ncbi:hypothetical protein EC973_001980 [Apophysomyces ossiformis]|uniref:BZIP domain-containing protein n=1 Tax=Apophysomyces ossiformis TaxID=679940 RepID=A0A8H7BY19_9FUNG|nr:hypothetical protein EC973_001980 [Apophysomyces ossiformis]
MDSYLQQHEQDLLLNQEQHDQPWHVPPLQDPSSPSFSFLQHEQYVHPSSLASVSPVQAIYVSNIPSQMPPTPQQQPQQQPAPPALDENGQPIKIRKKPGRKPNPASPALRKAQNRAAQRAFRERKERHLRDLENTIRTLREQRNSATKELNSTKSKLDAFRAENWYLKGVVLTLQFVCLHYNIHIPTHSPYLTEEALSNMAKTTPHAIEAYVNAYTRNNINLKPTMASHFSNVPAEDDDAEDGKEENGAHGNSHTINPSMLHSSSHNETNSSVNHTSRTPDRSVSCEQDEWKGYRDVEMDEESVRSTSVDHGPAEVKQEPLDEEKDMNRWLQHPETKAEERPAASSLSAIQRIRLQLRVQSTLTNIGQSAVRLQPTILQLAIPHDPRIDLIPTPHMRDRMIIFRDLMDYDRCFAMLLNGAVYHGGDPTMSDSWELPPEFFSEFWYLAINYDVSKTNKWRRLKGLPEIAVGANLEEHRTWGNQDNHQSSAQEQDPSMWTDDVLCQMAEGMPSLQPLPSNHFRLSPSPDTILSEQSHPLYEQIMGSPPETRRPARSPSLGAMMDLMSSLNTDLA